jgi:cell division transport system ATP-binding protein
MPQIRLEMVGKDYVQEQEKRVLHAVREINLTIEQGEFVFITGSSGAGKSTLLQILSCEMQPTSGAVFLDDVNITAMSRRRRERKRMLFGYVPQISTLVRKKTIEENLFSVAVLRPGWSQGVRERVQKALGLVGMGDVLHRYPAELSLGECRRVELARAIINDPKILVLDELTANLDEDTAWDLFLFLREVNVHGTTVIMASHAKKFVNLMRQRVITLVDGKILGDVQKGRYGDVV